MTGTSTSGKKALRPKKRIYYRIFFSHHKLPLPCEFCSEIIHKMTPNEVIHHVDEDPWNNDITNLQLMHQGCHKTHHLTGKPSRMTGKKHSAETRAKMRMSSARAYAEGRGAGQSAERNAKISAKRRGQTGQVHSPETRAKIGVGARETRLRERKKCMHCDLVSNNGAIARHIKAKHSDQLKKRELQEDEL